jgi:hypothetical protein
VSDYLSHTEFSRGLLANATAIAPFGTAITNQFTGPAPDSMRADRDGNLYVGFGPTVYRSPEIFRTGRQAALGKDIIDLMDALHIPKAAWAWAADAPFRLPIATMVGDGHHRSRESAPRPPPRCGRGFRLSQPANDPSELHFGA